MVRDHIPLEQGLRHDCSFQILWYSGQRPYSIRTRIKTLNHFTQDLVVKVRDHIPLEQGLRRATEQQKLSRYTVRDHIPLEQGLRRQRYSLVRNQLMSETIFH